jgi:hypothetical protein
MGNNVFEPNDLCGEGTLYRRVRSMDLNGDGYPEVVCSSASQEFGLELYINDIGHQVFTRQVLLDSSAFGLSIADLNGDGWEDIIVAHIMAQKVIWFENMGDSISTTYQIITDECVSPCYTAFADLDEDNDLDIIIGGGREDGSDNDGATYFCLNDGAGTFAKPIRLDAFNRNIPDHYPADVDGDGDSDIICASFRNKKISWFENDNVNFDKEIFINAEVEGPSMVMAADLDNDNDNEVIISSRWSRQLSFYYNTGEGIFGSQNVIEDYGVSLFSLADFDNDGYTDIASDLCDASWLRNLGDGNFELADCLEIWGMYNATILIETADLDGLNGPDIIAACDPHNPMIVWTQNTGGGILGDIKGIYSGEHYDAFTADLDEDGDVDIITAEYNFNWYENLGGGNNWERHDMPFNLKGADNVSVADIDNDGDLDIVGGVRSWDDTEWLGWFENNGNAQFTVKHNVLNIDTGLLILDLFVDDLNLDDYPDILCTYHYGDLLVWFENNGNGSFGEMKLISSDQISPGSVYASDMDNDGDPDVICASASDNRVLWYENELDNSVSEPVHEISLYPNPSSGIIYFSGMENGIAKIFSSKGVLISQYECSGKTRIDLSSQKQGVYILNFTGESGIKLNRKIAIVQ